MLSSVRVIQARARQDLSYGTCPDRQKRRFFEMTWFRVRPGHETQSDAAKAHGASEQRAGINAGVPRI